MHRAPRRLKLQAITAVFGALGQQVGKQRPGNRVDGGDFRREVRTAGGWRSWRRRWRPWPGPLLEPLAAALAPPARGRASDAGAAGGAGCGVTASARPGGQTAPYRTIDGGWWSTGRTLLHV